MLPFPTLHTSRCLLRQIVASDQGDIYRGLSDPEVVRYYGVRFDTYEATAQQMAWYEELWEKGTGMWWAVCAQDTGEFMGAIGLNDLKMEHRRAEVGFWLLPGWQGQGIMQEVLPEVVKYAFNVMGLHRLEALVESENGPSVRVLQGCGFRHEGTMRECEWKDGRWVSLEMYGLLTGKK